MLRSSGQQKRTVDTSQSTCKEKIVFFTNHKRLKVTYMAIKSVEQSIGTTDDAQASNIVAMENNLLLYSHILMPVQTELKMYWSKQKICLDLHYISSESG